ncbi:MAG: Crp/Fnr family transcriptional regulator [Chloroflexi bacterium CFX4]|nr:Crp/Fnr family transcriptional regulator [Chloroflexi bacterium CFX4]MDL1922040.1 Crp/Fnr family transcriptional regulator [Chloroflexi bacterium CFX3]
MTPANPAPKRAELFADLPPHLYDQLLQTARICHIRNGEYLFHQGELAYTFYLLQRGRLRLVQHTPEGKDVTLATFSEGDLIGLLVAISSDSYPATAEALEDCELLALQGAPMWQVMQQHAPLAVRVVRMLAARLHEAHERIRELSAERVQQRLARSLVRLARKVGVKQADGSIYLDVRLSRQDLAQMNGTTLETVSRTLTAWQREGLLDAGREQITLIKPHDLVLIADDLP